MSEQEHGGDGVVTRVDSTVAGNSCMKMNSKGKCLPTASIFSNIEKQQYVDRQFLYQIVSDFSCISFYTVSGNMF